jgi:hypothetical protein
VRQVHIHQVTSAPKPARRQNTFSVLNPLSRPVKCSALLPKQSLQHQHEHLRSVSSSSSSYDSTRVQHAKLSVSISISTVDVDADADVVMSDIITLRRKRDSISYKECTHPLSSQSIYSPMKHLSPLPLPSLQPLAFQKKNSTSISRYRFSYNAPTSLSPASPRTEPVTSPNHPMQA